MPKIRKNGKELANLKPLKTESYISSSRAVIGKCPYPKCTGEGHLSGKFDTHLFIEACPLKQKLTPETCVVRIFRKLFAKYRDLLKSSISKSDDFLFGGRSINNDNLAAIRATFVSERDTKQDK
ncbi:hypothetical protein T05_11925 [Trichinella murrelli]|uniref:Uncharacterized protein n=1 Tax=Trichinella murrelli TaxID=144512 RepID=A0A0V0T6E5_9BILA|nr:hypothetical protein T05_11925 [Trichinella murrelli]